ncbi:MAG: DUF4238 domain-containing protein [Candidatus Delongbacteria bacterium]|nr:DUF4238 domain-containing protein [Candidatus Delongbacteria bacterium]
MTQYKKQHFVPQSYLKAWCDTACPKYYKPYVWRFTKDGTHVQQKAPKNIFYENDMYTIKNAGERNLILEHGLQTIEDLFCRVNTSTLSKANEIDEDSKFIICLFISALHARTKARRNFIQQQYQRAIDLADKFMEAYKNASPHQRKAMEHSSIAINTDNHSMSYEEVKELAQDPLKHTLFTEIEAATPMLNKLDMAILQTENKRGFITSDNPCIWHDPEAYKRPLQFQSPALMYESIEIILPVSPSQLVLLNRQGINGYIPIFYPVYEVYNRILRYRCDEYFIVNCNQADKYWFS